jgi:hypothetical protein
MRPYNGYIPEHSVSTNDLKPLADRMWRLATEPRNIYVAAPITDTAPALRLAMSLQDAGFTVTSSWLRHDFSDKPDISSILDRLKRESTTLDMDEKRMWEAWKSYEKEWGERDLTDVLRSDTIIILADRPSTSGGYHVELGLALGTGKNVIAVGGRPNVFFWTDQVRYTNDTNLLVDWLVQQKEAVFVPPMAEGFQEAAVDTILAVIASPDDDSIPF